MQQATGWNRLLAYPIGSYFNDMLHGYTLTGCIIIMQFAYHEGLKLKNKISFKNM